jgi:hypothetical protein
MISNTFSTADATFDIEKRVKEAIQQSSSKLSSERLARLKGIKLHVDDLNSRGLLKRQEYSSLSSADFNKIFPLCF